MRGCLLDIHGGVGCYRVRGFRGWVFLGRFFRGGSVEIAGGYFCFSAVDSHGGRGIRRSFSNKEDDGAFFFSFTAGNGIFITVYGVFRP